MQKETARREMTPAEKIAILEQTRSGLVARKIGLENKIRQLEARRVKTEEQAEVKDRPF